MAPSAGQSDGKHLQTVSNTHYVHFELLTMLRKVTDPNLTTWSTFMGWRVVRRIKGTNFEGRRLSCVMGEVDQVRDTAKIVKSLNSCYYLVVNDNIIFLLR